MPKPALNKCIKCIHETNGYDFSVQDPENHILLRSAETGCEMVDVSLEETANFFMGHLVNLSREQKV